MTLTRPGKKLKRRLEDLEKRAASTSESPERSLEKPEPVRAATKPRAKHARSAQSASDVHSHSSTDRASYDSYSTSTQEDRAGSGSMFAYQSIKQLSASPPPILSYPSYSSLDPYNHSYSHPSSYHYSDLPYHAHNEYPSPVPSLLPLSVHSSAGPTKKYSYGSTDDDIISPFNMSYASMAGIDLGPNRPGHHHSQPENNIPVHTLPSIKAPYPQFHSQSRRS